MGGLRPIGSEKLEGMEKIRRIMEIARYKESIPQPVNEDKKTEYTAELANGKTYVVVREKSGYIIKESYDDLNSEYIEPIQNRKYFSSYSQALKKLNLMAKDFNQMYDNEEGMSLFTEQKKKFKLKLPGKKKVDPVGNEGALPPPEPVAGPPTSTPPPMENMGGELPPPVDDMEGELPPPVDAGADEDLPPPVDGGADDMGDEDLPPPPMDDMDDMDDEEDSDIEGGKKSKKEEGTTFKVIQKLTGKLAQKIRKYNSEDDMDPNDVKYIINSILSSLDVDLLDEDDLEEIISRLEGDFEEEEDEDVEDDEMSDEELPELPSDEEDEELPPPPPDGGEMTEYNELDEIASLSDSIMHSVGSKYTGEMFDKMNGEFNEEDSYGMHGAREPRHMYNHFAHGTFNESKVDKIITQYFNTSKKEIIFEEKKKIQKIEKYEKIKETNYKNVKNLSENIRQERMALKYMEKNPVSIIVGKTNKGSLVFKEGVINTKITINGLVI